jgi:hypothetical protein
MHNIDFLSRGWHQFAIKERMNIEKHRKNMERERERERREVNISSATRHVSSLDPPLFSS